MGDYTQGEGDMVVWPWAACLHGDIDVSPREWPSVKWAGHNMHAPDYSGMVGYKHVYWLVTYTYKMHVKLGV